MTNFLLIDTIYIERVRTIVYLLSREPTHRRAGMFADIIQILIIA